MSKVWNYSLMTMLYVINNVDIATWWLAAIYCFVKEKERQVLLIHCMRIIMKFDNYLGNIRAVYSVENWNCLPWYSHSEEGRKIYSHWIDLVSDSQARRLVADSLQRNPRATWTYTCPIKMCAALYIERDRSHDTPCASPMGIFYRGEFVRTSASTCVCVHMRTCVIHMHASREAGSNGNHVLAFFTGGIHWSQYVLFQFPMQLWPINWMYQNS